MLDNIGHHLSNFNNIIRNIAAPTSIASTSAPPAVPTLNATPQRRHKTISQFQKQEWWMEIPKMASFISLLQDNPAMTDTYMVLENDELCRCWIEQQLELA